MTDSMNMEGVAKNLARVSPIKLFTWIQNCQFENYFTISMIILLLFSVYVLYVCKLLNGWVTYIDGY